MTAGKVERLAEVEEQIHLLVGGLKRGVVGASLGEAAWRVGQHPCVQGFRLSPHVEEEGSGQMMAARSAHCVMRVVHHACLLRGSRDGVTTEATMGVQEMDSPETLPHRVTEQHGHTQP